MSILLALLVLALIVEAITYIVLKADLLERPRNYVVEKSAFLRELLSCGYCTSFWVSIVILSSYTLSGNSIQLFEMCPYWLNGIFCLLFIHRFSNIIHGSIDKYFDKDKDLRYRSMFTED
jgi:hypothetical protein